MWKLAAVAATASLLVAACGGSDSSSDTTSAPAEATDVKVAVVYLGTAEDKGWTYQHEQGILQLEKDLGVEVKRIENIADNADSE